MKVLVTGAGGFLGRAVVAACCAAGHDVTGLYRPARPPEPHSLPAGVRAKLGDLRQPGGWEDALGQAEAVIHCAAAVSGDLPTQLAGTVLATENLLAALPGGLGRFVHISSFSVYDFNAPSLVSRRLDEKTALEPDSLRRDAYTQTKLIQERMVREHCMGKGVNLVVLRPGAIYGGDRTWDYGRAMRVGPVDLVFAPLSPMRLVHVDNCAEAAAAALSAPVHGVEVLNIVDDEQPSHWRFHHDARRAGAPVGPGVPVPYWCVLWLGMAARIASVLFFKGRARLPELLDLPRQRVRWRGLHYPNRAARSRLGWKPRVSLAGGIADLVTAARSQSRRPAPPPES